MNLKPLGDRILIKPEIPANVTESGLILQEDRKPEQTGTVIAVGPCSHPRKTDAEKMADLLAEWVREYEESNSISWATDDYGNSYSSLAATRDLLRDLVRKEPEVKVGDYVVFSWTSGQEIWVEDGQDRLLLMRESDILCVVEGLEV